MVNLAMTEVVEGVVVGRGDGLWWWSGVVVARLCWKIGVDGRLAGCELDLLCLCLFLCLNRIINKIKPVVTGGFAPPKVVLHQWPVDCRGIGGFTALGWPDVS